MSWMASRIAGRAVRWIGNQRLGDDVSRVMNPFKCLSTANNTGNAPVTLPKAPEPQIVEALVAQTHTSAVLVPPQQVDGTKVVVKVSEEYPRELLASEPAELPKTNDKVVVKSPEEYPRELLAPEPAEPPKANDKVVVKVPEEYPREFLAPAHAEPPKTNDKVVVKVPEEYPRELLASEPAEPPKTNDKVVVKVPEEYPCELSAPAEIPKRNDLELPKREDSGETTRPDVPKAAETEPLSSALPNLGMKERQARSNSHEVRKDSVDKKETAKFAAIAATWWDPKGPYKPLHIMNPTRVSYIRSSICQHFRKDANTARPLEGLKIVDVGCGGGLVCEPFARMGAEMTGVDAVEKNIGVASVHAGRDPSTASIKYLWTTAEQLVREEQKFDVVLALEVIEHVADPEDFCRSLAALTKKDGLVFISTLNRSLPSFGLAIVAAEYILGWLPKGTHEWSKFITPGELSNIMDRSSIEVKDTAGMVYNPITQRWSISGSNTSVNYIAYGVNRSIKI